MTEWLIEASQYVRIFGEVLLIGWVGYPLLSKWRSDPSILRRVATVILAIVTGSFIVLWSWRIVSGQLLLFPVIVAIAAGIALAPAATRLDRRIEQKMAGGTSGDEKHES